MKTHIQSKVLVNEGLHGVQSVSSSSGACAVYAGKNDALHSPDLGVKQIGPHLSI